MKRTLTSSTAVAIPAGEVVPKHFSQPEHDYGHSSTVTATLRSHHKTNKPISDVVRYQTRSSPSISMNLFMKLKISDVTRDYTATNFECG